MHTKMHDSILNTVYIALFAALIAVCSWITIPIGVISITLQTMAVCITAGMLGPWRGTVTVAVWLAIGAVGLPVFSGFGSGIGALMGPTGGYLMGFLPMALIIGGAERLFKGKWYLMAASMVVGIAVLYTFGTAWFLILMGGKTTLGGALAACVFPFILPDLVKVAAATLICSRVKKIVRI